MGRVTEVRVIQRRIALVVFGVLGGFLFSSEFMNALFNNRLDRLDAGLVERLVFAFKPTVVAIYLVFALLLYVLIIRYLRPLMRFLTHESDHEQARTAAIKVPRIIIGFQLTAWTVGTTLYYVLHGWEAESGIPIWFGLPLKLAVGLPAGVYTAILFNLILIPAKHRLQITSLRAAEDDRFSRNRDYWVMAAVIVFMIVNLSYVSFYFAQVEVLPSGRNFYLPIIAASIFYGGVSFGLMVISKKEYFIQVESVRSILQRMAIGDRHLTSRINIINYNELGEIAGFANRIVDNFGEMLARIGRSAGTVLESSQSLSSASSRQTTYANEQASSTSQIVRTMDEVGSHSVQLGEQAQGIADTAQRMRSEIANGHKSTRNTMEKMEAVRRSNAETLNHVNSLGERVRDVWEIVTVISGVARRTRIIAFNATLQASQAQRGGGGFEVVANEIRQLAEEIVSSTAEVRARFDQIQVAADALIKTSREDSDSIAAAWTFAGEQESTFDSILELSDAAAEAADIMRRRVARQNDAFEQVVTTLKHTLGGVNEFASSIEDSNRTARSLNETVAILNEITSGNGQDASPPRARGSSS